MIGPTIKNNTNVQNSVSIGGNTVNNGGLLAGKVATKAGSGFFMNAFTATGSKYKIFNKDDKTNATINQRSPALVIPISNTNFGQAPAKGGTPMIDNEPTKKAINTKGMTLPMPFILEISVVWLALYTAPAHINNVILPNACKIICNAAPINANGVAIIAPKVT